MKRSHVITIALILTISAILPAIFNVADEVCFADTVSFTITDQTYSGTTFDLDSVVRCSKTDINSSVRANYYRVEFVNVADSNDKYIDITPVRPGTYSVIIHDMNGADGYDFSASGKFVINKKIIAVDENSVIIENKTYDGTLAAKVNKGYTTQGRIGSEDVSIDLAATFLSPDAAVNKVVKVTCSLRGSDRGNYQLGNSEFQRAATITPFALFDTAEAMSTAIGSIAKTYDGATVVQREIQAGNTLGDVKTVYVDITLPDAHVGTYDACTVTAAGATQDLISTGNYSIPADCTVSATVNIRAVTLSDDDVLIPLSKVYDGSDYLEVTINNQSSYFCIGDEVSINARGQLASVHAASNVNVSIYYDLEGADKDNYSISGKSSAQASIEKRKLTYDDSSLEISTSKQWDNTTLAAVVSEPRLTNTGADNVSLTVYAVYDSPTVGQSHIINVSFSLPEEVVDYSVPDSYQLTNCIISKRSLTILRNSQPLEQAVISKTYDGTTADSGTLTLGNTVEGYENVQTTMTLSYSAKNVGDAIPMVVIAGALAGSDSSNYTLSTDISVTGTILPRALAVDAPPILATTTKEFDGNNRVYSALTVGSLTGVIAEDSVTLTANATYSGPEVSDAKTITVTYILGGADKDNYSPPDVYTFANCSITYRGIGVDTASSFQYGEEVSVTTLITAVNNIPQGLSRPDFYVTYVSDGVVSSAAPVDVGVYSAVIQIISSSYRFRIEDRLSDTLIVSFNIVRSVATISTADLTVPYTGVAVDTALLRSYTTVTPVDARVRYDFYTLDDTPLLSEPLGAGKYYYRATVLATDNYDAVTGARSSFVIEKATAAITVFNNTHSKEDASKGVDVYILPEFIKTEERYLVEYSKSSDSGYSQTVPTEVGDYYLRISVEDDNYKCGAGDSGYVYDRYYVKNDVVNFNVVPVTAGIGADGDNAFFADYSGLPFSFGCDYNRANISGVETNVQYIDAVSGKVLSDAPVSSGSYTISVSVNDREYGKEGTARAYFTIRKKTVDWLTFSNTTAEYDGNVHNITVSGNDMGLNYNLSYTDESGDFVVSPISAGVYTVSLIIDEDNYSGALNGSLTISPSSATIQVKDGGSFEYTGKAFDVRQIISLKKSGVLLTEYSENITFEYKFVRFNGLGQPEECSIPTVPGKYGVRVRFADSSDFTTVDWSPTADAYAEFSIEKATVKVEVAPSIEYKYDENNVFSLSEYGYRLTNSAGVDIALDCNIVYKQNGVVTTPSNVGQYVIEISADGNDCYNALETVCVNLSIVANTLSDGDGIEFLGERQLVWNGEPQSIEISVDNDYAYDITYKKYDTENARYVDITSDQVLLPGSYLATVVITENNYSGRAEYDFEILKRNAVIVIDNLERVYGSTTSVVAQASVDGIPVEVDDIIITYYSVFGDNRKKLSTMPVDAGTYEVEAHISDTRYSGSQTASMTISKKDLIARYEDVTYIYNKQTPQLTLKYRGFEYDDNEGVLIYFPIPDPEYSNCKDVGTYRVKPMGGTANNYNIVYEWSTVTIKPKSLTIGLVPVAEGYRRGSTVNLNVLSFTYNGFVAGDTAGNCIQSIPQIYFDVDGDGVEYETSSSDFSRIPAGRYYVKLGGASAANYECFYEDPSKNVIDIYEYSINNGEIELSGVQMSDSFRLEFDKLNTGSSDYTFATKAAKSLLTAQSVLAIFDYYVLNGSDKLTNDTKVTLVFLQPPQGVDLTADRLSVYQISESGIVSEVELQQNSAGKYYVECNGISGKIIFATQKDYTWLYILIGSVIVAGAAIAFIVITVKKNKELKSIEKERGSVATAKPTEEATVAEEGDLDIDLDEAERIYKEAERRAKQAEQDADKPFGYTGGVKKTKEDIARERLMQLHEDADAQSADDKTDTESAAVTTRNSTVKGENKPKKDEATLPKVVVPPKKDKKTAKNNSTSTEGDGDNSDGAAAASVSPEVATEVGLNGEDITLADNFEDTQSVVQQPDEADLFDFSDLDI